MKLHARWVSIVFAVVFFIISIVCFLKDDVPSACYFLGIAIWFKLDAKWEDDP
jgi:hypothetical protein